MYVYRTPEFDAEVERQMLSDHINRLCDELQTMQLDEVQARFERVYPYLKRKEKNNLRLIARIYRIGHEYVLCWLKVFLRGDSEYINFVHHRDLNLEIDRSYLKQWIRSQQATTGEQASRQLLPDTLRPWLTRPDLKMNATEALVYESQLWLREFHTPDIKAEWEVYNELILQIADGLKSLGEQTNYAGVKLYGNGYQGILYCQIQPTQETSCPIVFLLAPFSHHPTEREITNVIETLNLTPDFFEPPIHFDDLSALAARAYPGYLVAEKLWWLAIENEEAANLALSAEEERILHAVSTANPSLPLFLNGQAGSGKSTMLFYLFADYCQRHLRLCQEQGRSLTEQPHPLFLAYNERLLSVAKERVQCLLKCHYRFLERRGEIREVPDISLFFKPFRAFLKELLPLEMRDRFQENHYISFHRFRQLCRKSKPQYSPERCWQVIRTFIKGYYLDEREDYLDLEDYFEIPSRDKTVSVEEFEIIYENVWKWYRNYTQEQEKWDDQDLIRAVLKSRSHSSTYPEYTAIFCDESQDFTKVELQLILRLSVFNKYDLEREPPIDSLPFAFAGDPLQTLNPTGFRWESLSSAFYDEVLTALFPTRKSGLRMNFAELQYNYRSVDAIVKVNNLIQLWRKVLFDLPEIQPQQGRKVGNFQPQKFILGENIHPDELKLYLEDTIILIPCDEGGEAEYVRKDEVLSHLVDNEMATDEPPWNVLSAIAAKGLEFKQVILYKFGEGCSNKTWRITSNLAEEVKYFFNKLYVAVSRATDQLFIVDSIAGEEKLWQNASDIRQIEYFLAQIKNRQDWEDRIQGIQRGIQPEEMGITDLIAIAKTLEEEGLNSENPELLKRACGAYKRLNDIKKSNICQAFALKFEQDFEAAGQIFLEQGEADLAWQCFWDGMCWEALFQWYEQNKPDNEGHGNTQFVRPLVEFMICQKRDKNDTQTPVIQLTKFLEGEIEKETIAKFSLSQQWQVTIQEYSQAIKSLLKEKSSFSASNWQRLGEVLQQLALANYPKIGDRPYYCFYAAQNYAEAIKGWENKDKKPTEYYLAKAAVIGMPEGLKYLEEAQQSETILAEWEQAGKPNQREWLIFVARVFEAKQDYKQAFFCYAKLNNLPKVKSCFLKATHNKPTLKALKRFLSYTIKYEHWEEAIATIETYLTRLPKAQKDELQGEFIYSLAGSTLTAEMLSTDQRLRYQSLIKEQFLSLPNWQDYCFIEQVGVALERVGSLVETLSFYEQFFRHSSLELQQFSRDRWLATKIKQQVYFQEQGQTNRANQIRIKLERKAQEWQISLDKISLTPPPIPKSRPTPTAFPKTPISITPESEIKEHSFHHLKITVWQATQQVLIQDRLSGQTLRIEGRSRKIKVGSLTLTASHSNQLLFSDSNSGYQGKLLYENNQISLYLKIEGISERYLLTLSAENSN